RKDETVLRSPDGAEAPRRMGCRADRRERDPPLREAQGRVGGRRPEAMAMKLTGAIFDLDGTLVDTLPVCFAAFRDAFARLGERRYEDDEIRALFGPSEEGMMKVAVPARWESALTLYLDAYERELRGCAPIFAGLAASLARLRARGMPVGLVTG